MSKEIKIGLIGAGWMGKAHTTAFHNARMIFGDDMPVFELVSDVSEDAVAKFAKNMGYNRYTTNWMDVVTDPEIDLVDVATPNCMHYEMAKAALEHGKHVFCEKPLSLSAEQSRELADLAKEKGVVNYCGFSNIMNPANQYVAELVKSGKLGKIMRVHATYDQDMLLDPSIPIAWRHINKLAGCGALGDLGSHLLSISQFIMGDITKVNAVATTVFPNSPSLFRSVRSRQAALRWARLRTTTSSPSSLSMKTVQLVTSRPLVLQPAARTTSITRFRAPRAR